MGLMDFFKKGKEEPVLPKANPQAAPTPASAAAPREYVIKSGDTLSKIAKQYYGNANDWKKIFEANTSTIKDANKIFPGQKIIIP